MTLIPSKTLEVVTHRFMQNFTKLDAVRFISYHGNRKKNRKKLSYYAENNTVVVFAIRAISCF